MNKAYSRIVWENYPSVQTPLNEQNLNKMDLAVDTIDDRVINMDTTKANQSELLGALSNVTYNDQTGVFVFTWKNGNTLTVDLAVEKIPTSFSMSTDGVITMTNADGTTYTADVSSLIKTYTFNNANGITWNVTTDTSGNKIVKAAINDGSITEAKLEVNFLANCRAAQSGAEAAKATSQAEALVSEGYARGTQNGVDVPPTSPYYHNNAKYYSDKAGGSSLSGLTDTDIQNPENGNVLTYDSSNSKWVNDGSLPEKVKTSELAYLGYTVPYEMPIQNYIDANRVFHQRVGRVDLGTLNWLYNTSGAYFNADLSDIKTRNSNMFCSIYTVYPYNVGVATMSDKSIKLDGSGANRIYIKNASHTSADTFKSAMSGVYLYYELAMEITFNADGNEKIPSIEKHFEVNDFTLPIVSKNLLNPTLDTATLNGVTCESLGNGTYRLNGNASADTNFLLQNIDLSSGTYKIVGCKNGSASTFCIRVGLGATWGTYVVAEYGSGETFTVSASGTYAINIRAFNGASLNNVIIKPMISKDLNVTYEDFVPYNTWLNSSALVGKALGKNLIPFPYADTSKTVNGITITVDIDGTIHANGTASDLVRSFMLVALEKPLNLTAGETYTYIPNCSQAEKEDTFSTQLYASDWSFVSWYKENQTFVAQSGKIYCIRLYVQSGKTLNDVTWKPMLVKGTVAPTKYEKWQGLTSADSQKYTKYAKVNTDKYASDFIPQYIDVVPSGTFFTEDEESNKSVLAQTVVFANDGFYTFAEDTPSADVRLRIGGVV